MGINYLNLSIYYNIVYRYNPCEFSHYLEIITFKKRTLPTMSRVLSINNGESQLTTAHFFKFIALVHAIEQ